MAVVHASFLRRRVPSTVRPILFTSVAVASIWTALVFAFGGLHFDDFVNIAESRDALRLSINQLRTPAFDGRWQPLKRVTFDLLTRVAGLTFWPYAVALAAAHLFMAAGVAVAARAIWGERENALLAAGIALGALNLTAYSVANVGSLHGILCVALTVWSAGAAIRGALEPTRRAPPMLLAAAAAFAACLYKETGVMAPVLAAYGVWLASRHNGSAITAIARAVAAPCVGIVAYFAVRSALDVPLLPEGGRYGAGTTSTILRNAAIVVAGVVPWGLAAWLGAALGARRDASLRLAAMTATAVAAVLPSLLLPWQSPNFWYAAAPVVALGVTDMLRTAARPGRASIAIAALAAASLTACVAVTWRTGAYRWGTYAESSVAQWAALPRHGKRVVWFDRDSLEHYGGLARTVGPGQRLAHALRLASGDPSVEAVACISVLVGPACATGPGDEMYLHAHGRLTPITAPPPGSWYVMH